MPWLDVIIALLKIWLVIRNKKKTRIERLFRAILMLIKIAKELFWCDYLRAVGKPLLPFIPFKEEHMEQLKQLLDNLELISFQDISEIPEDKQHELAEQIERLQDDLKKLSEKSYIVNGRWQYCRSEFLLINWWRNFYEYCSKDTTSLS